ncbi:MAG: tRNA 4-thiouridine(8) synthase ThiI, partial [Thermotogaceae bacterium]|nr:tRNA 4-thiouridine(8) synthase ThiI [Thermotogaceae bacterium]
MRKVVVVRYAEIGVKGKNRSHFEEVLRKNIEVVTGVKPERRWGRIYVDFDWEENSPEIFGRIFGIQNYSPAFIVNLDFKEIKEAAFELTKRELENDAKTFKVNAKRPNKNFPMGIYDINRDLGAYILKTCPELKVDVHSPDFILGVEIRDEGAVVYSRKCSGPGGLPVGVEGKALLLLSGGIDSPVAGWYMMRRGIAISTLSFISPPYTGKETIDKFKRLVEKLKVYSSGRGIKAYISPITSLLEFLKDNAPQKLLLVLQRRSMIRIATRFAKSKRLKALITGESIGQVASQTLDNMSTINEASDILVLKPLIGFDKIEIIEKAKEIGTYEISIEKHLDVCSVFTPKHPATKVKLEVVKDIEEKYKEDV